MCERRRDLRCIASEVGIRFGEVQIILTDILAMSKVSERWVPMTKNDLGSIFLGISCLDMKMIPVILSTEL